MYEQAKNQAFQSARASRPLSILVAEDNEINAFIACKLLKRFGHHPTLVVDGLAALKLLGEFSFDLVLMDIEMPIMDGIEASRCIRSGQAGERTSYIPIIALSGHDSDHIRDRCEASGINAVISKPFNFNDLDVIIRQVVSEAVPPPDDDAKSLTMRRIQRNHEKEKKK